MGIPQTMKAPTHLQVFCAESWGFRCVRYFFRVLLLGCWLFCKLKLLHSILFKGIKSEKQIYSGNLVLGTWEVVISLSLSLSLSSSAWFVLCIGRGRFSSNQTQLYRRSHRFPSLIIAYSWSFFASPINILQEKRSGAICRFICQHTCLCRLLPLRHYYYPSKRHQRKYDLILWHCCCWRGTRFV
jgi:hypothetical protein